MELSPLMFFFKKITCWIYHYNGIYIGFSFFFPPLFFLLGATLCIHDSIEMSKLCTWEAKHRYINGYLVHTWEGLHKLRCNINIWDVYTYMQAYTRTFTLAYTTNSNGTNFHSFCSKTNSTYKEKKAFYNEQVFFLSFNK